MTGSTMRILYGPPGTGKTWQAAREAVKAVEPIAYNAALTSADPDTKISELHRRLVEDGRIVWVTFHPGYSYEDFVEGYRPVLNENGQLIYTVVDGPFKKLCSRAKFYADLQIGEELTDATGRPAGIVIGKDAGGWIVQVRSNRSDSVAESVDKYVSRYVIERILERKIPLQLFSIPGKGLFKLSDFGLSSSDPDVPPPRNDETELTRSGPNIRRILAARTGIFSSTDLTNASHFGWVARKISALRDTAVESNQSVAIVIDEINRAEVSRVFGELLTLLEHDKRLGMPEERKVFLPYSKATFSVPQQLSIVGTMNTVDRSLTALDFAMRRRFEFQQIMAQPKLLSADYAGIDIQNILRLINKRISILLGSGFEIGHSHLMEAKLDLLVSSEGWKSVLDGKLRALALVFRNSILPTILEYFRGDMIKVHAVISQVQIDGKLLSLFDRFEGDAAFIERLSDDSGFVEVGCEEVAKWWDPHANEWDSKKYKSFMSSLAAGK